MIRLFTILHDPKNFAKLTKCRKVQGIFDPRKIAATLILALYSWQSEIREHNRSSRGIAQRQRLQGPMAGSDFSVVVDTYALRRKGCYASRQLRKRKSRLQRKSRDVHGWSLRKLTGEKAFAIFYAREKLRSWNSEISRAFWTFVWCLECVMVRWLERIFIFPSVQEVKGKNVRRQWNLPRVVVWRKNELQGTIDSRSNDVNMLGGIANLRFLPTRLDRLLFLGR